MNSAQGWSLVNLDDWSPEMDERGSVPLGYIETLVGSADLVGKWAIHSYIIEATGYSGQTARAIMREYPMPTVCGVPYTWRASLDAHLDARAAVIREGRLRRAEHLNENGPWTWRLSTAPTDPSSGSIR